MDQHGHVHVRANPCCLDHGCKSFGETLYIPVAANSINRRRRQLNTFADARQTDRFGDALLSQRIHNRAQGKAALSTLGENRRQAHQL